MERGDPTSADLDGGEDGEGDVTVVVGHSVGASILISTLAERPPEKGLAAIVLISASFVGEGGWPGEEFELAGDLGTRFPDGVPVHVFHGLEDETAPPAHADLYAQAIPQAQVHRLPGRDHQLNNDLSDVAAAIGADAPGRIRTDPCCTKGLCLIQPGKGASCRQLATACTAAGCRFWR